jgi:hypothetical protein
MATFVTNDRVEVRGAGAHAWRAGVVSNDAAGKGGGCYEVTLDTPVNANAWGGRTRKYAGSNLLSVVAIFKNAETLDPGVYIKAEGT